MRGCHSVFATERQNKIKQLLLEYDKVDVGNLSEILAVSEVTIRKDLEKLENAGFLIRTHGGAVLKEDAPRDEQIIEHDIPNIESKKMIGIFAAALVQDRDVVFLGPGSTCIQIAKSLRDKRDIIVITNNIGVMSELAGAPYCRVLGMGGEIDSSEYGIMMSGEIALKNLQDMYINKALISVDGITFRRGFMMRNAFLAKMYQTIKDICDEIIVVADHTKFNLNSLSNVGPLGFADKVVSDQLAPHEYIKYFFEHDIQIFTTYPMK
jgi:DeoR/GlpR family transcriptional regulator of sugar metabolism